MLCRNQGASSNSSAASQLRFVKWNRRRGRLLLRVGTPGQPDSGHHRRKEDRRAFPDGNEHLLEKCSHVELLHMCCDLIVARSTDPIMPSTPRSGGQQYEASTSSSRACAPYNQQALPPALAAHDRPGRRVARSHCSQQATDRCYGERWPAQSQGSLTLRVPRSASLCILLKPANANAAITATRYASKGARQNVEGRQQLKTPFAVIQASGAKRPFFGLCGRWLKAQNRAAIPCLPAVLP